MKLQSLLTILFLVLGDLVFAQNELLYDSIRSECSECSLSEFYERMAWGHRKIYPDSTLYYCDLAIQELKQKGDTNHLAILYNFKGVAYHYKGDNLSSYDFYYLAHKYAESHADTVQYGHSMNNLGRFFASQGDYSKAFDYCERALETFELLNDRDGIAYALKRLTEMYVNQGYPLLALKASKRALDIRLNYYEMVEQSYAHVDIARVYANLDSIDQAYYHFRLAIDKSREAGDVIGLTSAQIGISNLEIELNNYKTAVEIARQAKEAALESRNLDIQNRALVQYGIALYHDTQLDEALKQFNMVLANSALSNQLPIEKEAHFYLSNIYAFYGLGQQAYIHQKRFGEIDKQLSHAEARRAIDSLMFVVELERRDQENELLKANERANEALISAQRKQNIVLTIGVILLVVMAVVLFQVSRKRKLTNEQLIEKNKRIAEQQQKIFAQNEQITAQNAQLKGHNQQLADMNEEKDMLMNIVAHDLKSPVNRVLGISQLLNMTKLNDEQQSYVQMLQDVSNNNINFIRDLLDVTAFEGSERKLNLEEFDIKHLIVQRLDNYKDEVKSKNLALETVLPEEECLIATDKEYLSRIIDNLMSNAIKFSDRNKFVHITLKTDTESYQLSIKDEGPGFSEKDKESLYKKFAKLSAQPTAGENSSGLGLALVKNLVDKLDGEITLITKLGKGSEFVVSIPKK